MHDMVSLILPTDQVEATSSMQNFALGHLQEQKGLYDLCLWLVDLRGSLQQILPGAARFSESALRYAKHLEAPYETRCRWSAGCVFAPRALRPGQLCPPLWWSLPPVPPVLRCSKTRSTRRAALPARDGARVHVIVGFRLGLQEYLVVRALPEHPES